MNYIAILWDSEQLITEFKSRMQLQAKLTMNIIGSAETLITITTLLLIVGHSVCLKLICT